MGACSSPISLTQSRREKNNRANTSRLLRANSFKTLLQKCRQFEGRTNGFSRVSRLAPSTQRVIGHSFLFLPVRCGYCEENTPTNPALCSRRRLRWLSTLNPCHSLAAMLNCCLNDSELFSVSVVARANASITESAGGSRLLGLQRRSPSRRHLLAQTKDGFLWLGGPNGLFRFDGTRFEPFRSPFGDRLLSPDVYSLFATPSGGLWIGYTFGGFSYLDGGRVTNYASETGSVRGFAQDRDGVVWASTTTGLDCHSWVRSHPACDHSRKTAATNAIVPRSANKIESVSAIDRRFRLVRPTIDRISTIC